MAIGFAGHAVVLLDACCLLNLYATGRAEEILGAIPVHFALAQAVASEALYVRRGGSGKDADDREPVVLQLLVSAGLLELWQVKTEDEVLSFIQFAAQLDDGEAMTCALAVHRGAAVATDDRKALRLLQARAPQVAVRTTASLIKTWAESCQVGDPDLRQVLADVRARARFAPGKHDALQGWWEAKLRG